MAPKWPQDNPRLAQNGRTTFEKQTDEEVGGAREALEAVDGEVEVADEEGLVALRPHEEGAHVGLEKLAAAGDPRLQLVHGHGGRRVRLGVNSI